MPCAISFSMSAGSSGRVEGMRLAMILMVGVVLPAMAGCAAHHERHRMRVLVVPDDRPAELASALLFDARPGRYDPQSFAVRSEWPSTPAFYSPGQVIYFSEWFVDYQGRNAFGGPFNAGTYRRAESLRTGVGYRP